MSNISDRRDQYANQGQQDDYFDQDLAIAGQEPKPEALEENAGLDEYRNQGQQDDYFDEDLANRSQP